MSSFAPFAIEVYCDDPSSRRPVHNGRTAKVIIFEAWGVDIGSGPAEWGPGESPTRAQRDFDALWSEEYVAAADRLPSSTPDVWRAAADEALSKLGQSERPEGPEVAYGREIPNHVIREDEWQTSKYRMRCKLCLLDLQVRHDRVVPVLERLRANDVRRISLTALDGLL